MTDAVNAAQAASFNSMKNVLAGNRAGWVDLFADDAVIQDPVGVSPLDPTGLGHKGKEAIGRFWDATVATSRMRLEIVHSFPCADECANLVRMDKDMPNGKVLEHLMIVVYRANKAGKIVSLKAYWEFDKLTSRIRTLMAT